ncbi:MAG: thiamine diphosphokinase [Clostridium sp.]|nr:thiamine diphosphokinase [Clostridium sp.]MBP3215190.1 thiamine diphosphokinase [Clostridium sp.]
MKSKSCLIITGGRADTDFAREFVKNRTWDIMIAADAGLVLFDLLGICPDIVVGDLDSAGQSLVQKYRNKDSIRFEVHRPEKDETDTELALRLALREGCLNADILGALGGRLDHELANIQLLSMYQDLGLTGFLYDPINRIHMVRSGEEFHRGAVWGKYISFIPLSEQVSGVTLKGFKYPLTDCDVRMGSSLMVSNELAGEQGEIVFSSGRLLCVESHD